MSRYRTGDLTRLISAHPEAPPMSRSTIWRRLDRDARRPWRHHRWLFPREPAFAQKAGVVLDLYAGLWLGQPLHPDDCLLSADEQTSIQARQRRAPSRAPIRDHPQQVEHEDARQGALAYLAAWDVRRGRIIGRCEPTTGKAPFGRLVDQVMQQAPYQHAPRVCWLVDQGSSQRGAKAADELAARYPNLILVHLPVHASWLNQIELYCSILQRKVLTPNDFADLVALEQRLLAFETYYHQTAQPFAWRFTRQQLDERLAHLPAAA